jgi:hypothetical protein
VQTLFNRDKNARFLKARVSSFSNVQTRCSAFFMILSCWSLISSIVSLEKEDTMATQSRIKFNPETQEIEIEGSEKFVKNAFDKIQAMLLGEKATMKEASVKVKVAKGKPIKEKSAKEKSVKKERKSKKAPKVVKRAKPLKESRRGSKSNAVLTLIQNSPEGITTTELEEKTGLTDKQIWAVVFRGEKMGKIKKVKRGLYAAV